MSMLKLGIYLLHFVTHLAKTKCLTRKYKAKWIKRESTTVERENEEGKATEVARMLATLRLSIKTCVDVNT